MVLFTLTATATGGFPDASDLGYLLHKHPDRVQTFELSVGTATVLYPESSQSSCTVAMILDVDPVDLARSKFRRGSDGFALGQYVNDRPYAGSSMLAVAISRVFKSALAGTLASRQELPLTALPLRVTIPAMPARGGADLPGRLFGPLGWDVIAEPLPLDETIPQWGDSAYVSLTLVGTQTLSAALRHLYVLLPVLDDVKHYWVGEEEADKLVRMAGEWLSGHPEAELIASRYLAHRRELVASVVDRLVEDATTETGDVPAVNAGLANRRQDAVIATLEDLGVARVVDVGCGEGKMLRELLARPAFTKIVGVDVSDSALRKAERRLGLAELSDRQRERISVLQSSATYRDPRLRGYDAVVLMEVVEHVDESRLPALVRSVFADMHPRVVLVTTPNAEYNVLYPNLEPGTFRHPDHRFEFSRTQFEAWAAEVTSAHDYDVSFTGIGDVDGTLGAPTQMAVFIRREVSA
ncbi:3' terminal RNA ribose 2'-O-methyltransferase Hen1 [Rhodococcus sp. OK611]|jgi:3' terminal RNA ribose 2'-O-methyltransferase Hen1|uniref:3' terminal RNA ribose 2'-O-methyltransferase Hen1 n=1 Tax=unclassified Rhodococcus (in: high G+C Gram-positive bacteria) TaxID=192944 RepID=UPI000BD6E688|nr:MULTISPECIES: 3' terminal RNA ribose 2'-O-methyltransferase Hen1 [unclassified Rhodococcus (in: high G+C Gram-positive bacteria)]PTR40621.1 3' terminal RNA ribose 2'-O-methyltransferase Hen1 [Rhodococcus sp. OK611]SNX92312.1 3' terminal RNA ribose 2'-O-methyltransferase Hen1 [Rhodococcus sp. OK270]